MIRKLTTIVCGFLLISCGKPSRISELEKKQIKELMNIGAITMTVDERRYFDESKNNHIKRLDFLNDVAQQEKTRGMSILIPEKIENLQSFQELIQIKKKMYRAECIEAGYKCDDIQ